MGKITKDENLHLGDEQKDENLHRGDVRAQQMKTFILGNFSKHYQPSSTTRGSTVICPLDTPKWMLYWDYNNLTTKVSSKNPHSF